MNPQQIFQEEHEHPQDHRPSSSRRNEGVDHRRRARETDDELTRQIDRIQKLYGAAEVKNTGAE